MVGCAADGWPDPELPRITVKQTKKQQQGNYNLTDRLQNVLFLAHLGNPRMILVFRGDRGYAEIPEQDL